MKKYIISIVSLALFVSTVYSQSVYQKKKLVAPDRSYEGRFGNSVDISNNFMAIGAYGESYDSLGRDSIRGAGAVYIYKKNSNQNWIFHQKINSADRRRSDVFGCSISISGDFLIIGSYYNRFNEIGQDSIHGTGAAYVFKRDSNDQWIEMQKLVASDRNYMDYFGNDVSIDGTRIIIGAKQANFTNGRIVSDGGAAYIFELDSLNNWLEIKKVFAHDTGHHIHFGTSVSISGDYALVSAPGSRLDAKGNNYMQGSGAAYIYHRDLNGNWYEKQKIVASDRSLGPGFGTNLAIENKIIVVSAALSVNGGGGSIPMDTAGSVYVFEFDQNGLWIESAKLFAFDRKDHDRFGFSVDTKNELICVSAIFESEDENGQNTVYNSGSAYLYRKIDNVWTSSGKLKAIIPNVNSYYGLSIAIDSNVLVVGSGNELDENEMNPISRAGAVYVISDTKFIGIDKMSKTSNIKVYPNPTSGNVSILTSNSKGTIRLLDFSGRIIKTVVLRSNQTELNVNGTRGIYFIQIIGENSEVQKTIKIIKQ